jgi:hypothetical protein
MLLKTARNRRILQHVLMEWINLIAFKSYFFAQ